MGIFPREVKDIIFTRDEIEPTQGEIETNIGKLGNSKNSNFLFGWRGPLVMIFGGVGAGGPDWGGAGGAMAGSRMGQGVGARRARW